MSKRVKINNPGEPRNLRDPNIIATCNKDGVTFEIGESKPHRLSEYGRRVIEQLLRKMRAARELPKKG